MLTTLRVTNLAVVDELEVEFGAGLNVLTGETGSGKSVILRAIELLSGRRATADLIRHEQERCTVEGVFAVSSPTELVEKLPEDEASLRDLITGDEILVRRVIDRTGRGKIYVNGGLVGAGSLQFLGEQLIDLTGQHQQQTLLDAGKHLGLLDMFGVPEKLRQEMKSAYDAFAEARARFQSFARDSEQQSVLVARYEEELKELDAAGLVTGGRAELEAELHRLQHSERLIANIQRALAILETDEQSLDSGLREILGVLEKSAVIDPGFTAVVERIEAAGVELAEASMLLTQLGSRLDMSPERLEELRERVAEIARLERKYGKKEDALVGYRDEIREKLTHLGGGAGSLEKLKGDLDAKAAEADRVATKLSATRTKLAAELSQLVGKDLSSLNMKRAKFHVLLAPKEISGTGKDGVEFLFSANPGEPPRPLQKVASGGELSRVLLVLKTLLNQRNLPGTQVFDEIDSGVSGAVSQIVGEKLLSVASRSQVILVTHSPQIASLADHHFLIEKAAGKNSTRTTIRSLDRAQRIQQLAAMLAGKDVSTHFEKSAEDLLNVRGRLSVTRASEA